MTENRTMGLKNILLGLREQVLADIHNKIHGLREESQQTTEHYSVNQGGGGNMDGASNTEALELRVSFLQKDNEKLLLINEALERLEDGQYGICSDCGEEISEARLKILSFAIRCTACEEKRERAR